MAWIAALAIASGIIGHGLMMWAHHYLDVSLTSLLALGNPVLAAIGGWVVFSQELGALQIAGAAVVIVALGAIVRRQRSDHALARAAEAAAIGDLLDQ